MNSNSFSKVMSIGSTVFGAIFLSSLLFSNPEKGLFVKITFLVSLFLFIFCFFSLILFRLKKRASNNEIVHLYLKSSTREALLIGLFVIISLLLGLIDLLTWWDALLLAFSLMLIELYFKSGKVAR